MDHDPGTTDLTNRVAHFFVPLPEPLGMPDGFTFETVVDPSYDEWLEHDRQRATDHSDRDLESRLRTSLRFWRATCDVGGAAAFRYVFDLCRDKLRLHEHVPAPARQEQFRTDRTVVEMVVPLQDDIDLQDALTDGFDAGLDSIRLFQRAYYVGRRQSLTLITSERLPMVVPYAMFRASPDSEPTLDVFSIFLLNANLRADTRDDDLSHVELEKLQQCIHDLSQFRVFGAYLDLYREARVELERDGSYRTSVVLAGTASEVLLDDLLSHMLWEEVKRPEDAALTFDAKPWLASRVKTEFHERLGGNWSLEGTGPAASWHQALVSLRHRVVHAGHDPSRGECVAAMRALDDLQAFIGNRLAMPQGKRRFPRTALALLGEPGLRRRGAWDESLAGLIGDRDEPLWGETFARWRHVMQQSRSPIEPVQPDPSRAVPLLVLHPSGHVRWCLHDRRLALACVAEPPGELPARQAQAMERLLASLREQDPVEPISVAVFDANLELPHNAKWVPEYRLVPLAGVMVDRSDLDPPTG